MNTKRNKKNKNTFNIKVGSSNLLKSPENEPSEIKMDEKIGSIEKDILMILYLRDKLGPRLLLNKTRLLTLMLPYLMTPSQKKYIPNKNYKGKVLMSKFYRALNNLESKKFVFIGKDNIILKENGRKKLDLVEKSIEDNYNRIIREHQFNMLKKMSMENKFIFEIDKLLNPKKEKIRKKSS